MAKCDYDCFNCKYDDCINDTDLLTLEERQISKENDDFVKNTEYEYGSTSLKRYNKNVDAKMYDRAKNRHFHKKYYYRDVEKSREKSRENFYKHREARLEYSRKYYDENRDDILAQKKSYYLANREKILKTANKDYVSKPHREVIDTPQARAKRERERLRYQKNREEINRRRRERRILKNADSKRIGSDTDTSD